MKRDMDLVRAILLNLEDRESHLVPGCSEETYGHYIYLLNQAGFVDVYGGGKNMTPSGTMTAIPISLTWDGHDFLESIRDEARWIDVKAVARSAGSWSVELLKYTALVLGKRAADGFINGI